MSTHELDHLFGKRSEKAQLEADTDALMFRFLSIVDRVMESNGITKRTLAQRIGTSPAYVTQLFRGHKTINLETLAKMERALGIQFSVSLGEKAYELPEERGFFQAAES
jgi:ribosome-binding protein aMBF1 (putative translation factor)